MGEERVNAEEVGWEGGVGRLRGWGTVERMGRECGLTLMLTDPSTFDSSPRRAESREDFPAPTGPTTARRQPCGTVRFILATQTGVGGTHSWVGPCLKLCRLGGPQTQPPRRPLRGSAGSSFLLPTLVWLRKQPSCSTHMHGNTHVHTRTHTQTRSMCAHNTTLHAHRHACTHTCTPKRAHTVCTHTNMFSHMQTHVHKHMHAHGDTRAHRVCCSRRV